jgi:small conductance mechanosensitive channel
VKFDNAGGTVEEISLRKTTLRDLDGTVHHIPHGEIKKVSNFLRISPV